jgi:hypothetical protein
MFRPFILTTEAVNKLKTGVINSLGYNHITVAQSFVLQNGELHTTFLQKRCRASPLANVCVVFGIQVTLIPKRNLEALNFISS